MLLVDDEAFSLEALFSAFQLALSNGGSLMFLCCCLDSAICKLESFEALGDQIKPGPTLTNVNDFRAILIV